MPAATQSQVTYYLWEELTPLQQSEYWRQSESWAQCPGEESAIKDHLRNALWFRGPTDGGRWERIPLHPSDAARFRCPS
jgi:hypothetical protein